MRRSTVAQIACAVLLVIAAGLLVSSLWMLSHLDPGFQPDQIVTARISADRVASAASPIAASPSTALLDDQLQAAPGVSGAALVNTLPLTGAVAKRSLELEGYHGRRRRQTAPLFWLHVITPGYFRRDGYARGVGPGLHPRGSDRPARRDRHGSPRRDGSGTARTPSAATCASWASEHWHTIVGVIADVRAYDLTRDVPEWIDGTIYVPHGPNATMEDGRVPTDMTLTLRTTLDGAHVEAMLRRVGRGRGRRRRRSATSGRCGPFSPMPSPRRRPRRRCS